MPIMKVKKYFEQFGISDRIIEFNTSSATVELASMALNCAPERIAKTLSFKFDDKAVLIVTSGNAKIDNQKFKLRFNRKAKMLMPDEVITLVGYPIGGVCPFCVNDDVKIFLDISLKGFKTVFPACGSSNSAIEMTIDELEKYSCFSEWIDVCKNWNE